ncbi:hypothetical protein KSD_21770 [Ktedonobacter sp. SOSP1-85]|nr:hypothetical protein KSD_21770 [Ktedonobacter sp. SOSP1-85]
MGKEPLASRRSSYGWILVGVLGLTTILSYGTTQYLFGTLVVPVSDTFHWNRASISSVYAVSLLLAGLLGVPVGYLVDRYGARLLMTLGSLLGGLTFFGLASAHAAWQFALLWAAGMGIAMALFLYPVTFTVITTWFEQGRGKAFAVLTFLGGLASPIFFPLAGSCSLAWVGAICFFSLGDFILSLPCHSMACCCGERQGERTHNEHRSSKNTPSCEKTGLLPERPCANVLFGC